MIPEPAELFFFLFVCFLVFLSSLQSSTPLPLHPSLVGEVGRVADVAGPMSPGMAPLLFQQVIGAIIKGPRGDALRAMPWNYCLWMGAARGAGWDPGEDGNRTVPHCSWYLQSWLGQRRETSMSVLNIPYSISKP